MRLETLNARSNLAAHDHTLAKLKGGLASRLSEREKGGIFFRELEGHRQKRGPTAILLSLWWKVCGKYGFKNSWRALEIIISCKITHN